MFSEKKRIICKIEQCCILLAFLFMGVTASYAQEERTEFRIDFRVSSSVIEPEFSDNERKIAEIKDFLEGVMRDDSVEIVSVSFCGMTSPDGTYQTNIALSRRRLKAIEQVVRGQVQIPESKVRRDEYYIPWHELREWVEASDLRQKAEVLSIIAEEPNLVEVAQGLSMDARIRKLQALDDGEAWSRMNAGFFQKMRSASTVVVTFRQPRFTEPVVDKPAVEDIDVLGDMRPIDTLVTVEDGDTVAVVEAVPVDTSLLVVPCCANHIHLKTNAVGWGLLMMNVAGEIDICPHVSFTLPVYYSGVNYFTYTVKFRTFSVQPEVRYWLSRCNDGFFAGAHFGLSYFDFAFDGKYRYQDHDRRSPAMGGGVSVGYRLPVSRDKRWRMEFAVGGGVYSTHYDTFLNVPNGRRTAIYKKTYWGIDQAAISVAYSFHVKKGGGGR